MMSFEVKASPVLWRWATEEGQPQEGSEEELVRQLATGRVPPFALVWREGWGEWLPAMHVAELAVAFPSVTALHTAHPSSVPGNVAPGTVPPVPVSEYPRLRLLAKETPGIATEFECPEREVITSEVPIAALLEAARVMNEPSPPVDLGLDAAVQRAHERRSRPSHAPREAGPEYADFPGFRPDLSSPLRDSERPPPSRPAPPLAAELGLASLIEPGAAAQPRWLAWVRSHGVWVAVAAVALGISALFAARWVAASRVPAGALPSGVAALTPVASPPAQPASSSPAAPVCSLAQEPVKLDNWAVVDVRPSLVASPGGSFAWLGYAQSHKHATGGRLEIATLDFQRTFGQQQERQIYSVTPLLGRGSISYHVERQGALVAFGRALDMIPPVRIGMNDDGLVLGPLDRRSLKLWELPVGTLISVPEVAAHAQGFTLALRAGRTTGHLLLGALDPSGKPSSPLEAIGTPDAEYGRPALASGPEQTALAVSLRRSPEGPYDLMVGRAPNGRLPLELTPLDLPGVESVEPAAPALAALPEGGFALMWTEGSNWRRRVRLARLSHALVPMGAPIDVSTPDPALGGATAGALHWASDRLLAFYYSRREEGHSLWVTSVTCAR